MTRANPFRGGRIVFLWLVLALPSGADSTTAETAPPPAGQVIEALQEADFEFVARSLLLAKRLIKETTGSEPDGTRADLQRIQKVLDSSEELSAPELHALGLTLGRIFLSQFEGFDWWMVQDQYGRDPGLRYRETRLIIFPMTMLSKRVERGEPLDVESLFDNVVVQVRAAMPNADN